MATAPAGGRERIIAGSLSPDNARTHLAPIVDYLTGDSGKSIVELQGFNPTQSQYLIGGRDQVGILTYLGNRPSQTETGGVSYTKTNIADYMGGKITIEPSKDGSFLVVTAGAANKTNLERQYKPEWGDKDSYLTALSDPYKDGSDYLMKIVVAKAGRFDDPNELVKITQEATGSSVKGLTSANEKVWGVIPASVLPTLRLGTVYEVSTSTVSNGHGSEEAGVEDGSATGITRDRLITLTEGKGRTSRLWRHLPSLDAWGDRVDVIGQVPSAR